jgi:hypothetical protein
MLRDYDRHVELDRRWPPIALLVGEIRRVDGRAHSHAFNGGSRILDACNDLRE